MPLVRHLGLAKQLMGRVGMDWFSIVVTVVIGTLMMGFIAMLGVNVVRNLRDGEQYREGLERSVNSLRLGAMANRIGLSSVQLVHQAPVPDLRRQIEQCEGCQHTTACDQVLADEPDSGADKQRAKSLIPEFCVNSEQLGALSEALPAAS